jgi:hypothetical protein
MCLMEVSERRIIFIFQYNKHRLCSKISFARSSEIVKLITDKNRAINMLFYGITHLEKLKNSRRIF